MELTNQELDVSYNQGLLEGFLEKSPEPVKAALQVIVDGVAHYRQKYLSVQEDFVLLQNRYESLVALSSQYLGMIQELRTQNEQLLIEQQRPFHHEE